MDRVDGRQWDELRPITITRNYTKYAEGSVLIETGNTRVICTATVEDRIPNFRKYEGLGGWVTAEYGMLPRATGTRTPRESARGRVGGRTYEIQRLIGRSMRAVVDFKALGDRTVLLDCDVIQADGGTRTASITGAFVAMADALNKMMDQGLLEKMPLKDFVAATSVGMVGGRALLDLCYVEDFRAQVDMNIVMTGAGRFVEVQGTGEESSFSGEELQEMLGLARQGVGRLVELQRLALDRVTIKRITEAVL